MEVMEYLSYRCLGDAVLVRSPSDEQLQAVLRAVMYTKLPVDSEHEAQPLEKRLNEQLGAFADLFWNPCKWTVDEFTSAQEPPLGLTELARQAIDRYLPLSAQAAAKNASTAIANNADGEPSEFVAVVVNSKRSAYLLAVSVETAEPPSNALPEQESTRRIQFTFRQFEILPMFWKYSEYLAEHVDEQIAEHVVELPQPH